MSKKKKQGRSATSRTSGYAAGQTATATLTKREERKRARSAFMQGFFGKRWVWVILAIAVSVSILVGFLADRAFSEVQYITPHSIAQEFQEGSYTAEFKYVDKEVIATGIVSWTGTTDVLIAGERFMIKLQDEDNAYSEDYLECYFSTDADLSELADIEIGEKLQIRGKFVGGENMPMMAACSIESR